MVLEGLRAVGKWAFPGAQHRAGAHWGREMNRRWGGPGQGLDGRAHLLLHQGVAGRALLAVCAAGREEEVVLAEVTLVAHKAGPAHTRAVLVTLGRGGAQRGAPAGWGAGQTALGALMATPHWNPQVPHTLTPGCFRPHGQLKYIPGSFLGD